MVDMKKLASEDAGYEFRIAYFKESNQFRIKGYIIKSSNIGALHVDLDGGPLYFDSLEKILKHLTNFK